MKIFKMTVGTISTALAAGLAASAFAGGSLESAKSLSGADFQEILGAPVLQSGSASPVAATLGAKVFSAQSAPLGTSGSAAAPSVPSPAAAVPQGPQGTKGEKWAKRLGYAAGIAIEGVACLNPVIAACLIGAAVLGGVAGAASFYHTQRQGTLGRLAGGWHGAGAVLSAIPKAFDWLAGKVYDVSYTPGR